MADYRRTHGKSRSAGSALGSSPPGIRSYRSTSKERIETGSAEGNWSYCVSSYPPFQANRKQEPKASSVRGNDFDQKSFKSSSILPVNIFLQFSRFLFALMSPLIQPILTQVPYNLISSKGLTPSGHFTMLNFGFQEWHDKRKGNFSPLPCRIRTCREAVNPGLFPSTRREGNYRHSSIATLRAYLMPPMLK